LFGPNDTTFEIRLNRAGSLPEWGQPFDGLILVFLQWSNPFGQSDDDFAVCNLPANPDDIFCSLEEQDGDDDPVDVLGFVQRIDPFQAFSVAQLIVGRFNDADNETLELFVVAVDIGDATLTFPDADDIVPQDSLFGHAALPGVISTGAINAGDPGNDDIAPYSSLGPSAICLFNGSACDTAPGFELRATPAMTGIDGVSVSPAGLGFSPFFGTSAAAPHIAALAALLLDADPTLTPAEILLTLQSTATDLGTAGFDNTFGAGLANALAAINFVPPNLPPTAVSVTPSSGSGPGSLFSYMLSDADGFQDLGWTYVMFNKTWATVNSCVAWYAPFANKLYLADDAGAWTGPMTPGAAGTLQNTQCTLNVGNSSVNKVGTNMTLNLDLTFHQNGTKTTWLYGADSQFQNTGWVSLGNWTVTGSP